MKDIVVEPYIEKGTNELLEFAKSNFIDAYAHLNTDENMDAYLSENFTRQSFNKEYEHPHSSFFVARDRNQIVGYFKVNTESAQTEPDQHNSCEIERIYVDKAFKGKGVGKKLFQAAIDYARELKKDYVWLGVWEKNQTALRFYERIGMKRFGTHTFQLGKDAQEDILMRLDLNGQAAKN